ncbi:hypothetical protein ABZ746_38535 [Streptomyces sp. NPDC020096]
MDPRGGDYRTQACSFAYLAVPGGEAFTERQEELARAVLELVLLAGLPPYNAEQQRTLRTTAGTWPRSRATAARCRS